jgi:hypothetical protein
MNRINGPRFLPSGKRLGPYFWRRVDASPTARPFSVLVVSRFSTSWTVRACQGTATAIDVEFTAASICFFPSDSIRSVPRQGFHVHSFVGAATPDLPGAVDCAAKLPVVSGSMARKKSDPDFSVLLLVVCQLNLASAALASGKKIKDIARIMMGS